MTDPLDAFTLKDMILSVIAKLDRLDTKLDGKADEAVVIALESRIGTLERIQQGAETRAAIVIPQIAEMRQDITTLRDSAASQKALEVYKRWLFAVSFGSIVGAGLTLLQATGVLK